MIWPPKNLTYFANFIDFGKGQTLPKNMFNKGVKFVFFAKKIFIILFAMWFENLFQNHTNPVFSGYS